MRELVPLETRMGLLGLVRVLLVAAAGLATLSVPAASARLDAVLTASSAYLAFVVTLEIVRRAGRLSVAVVGVGLLMDAAYLVTLTALTGGPVGALSFLAPTHLIAVTLLASYRTGLKLALWYSVLFASVASAGRAALIATPPLEMDGVVTAVTTLWFVALVTAACSAVNERELRRGRAGYGALASTARALQRIEEPEDVLDVLAEAVRASTGYARAAVLLRADDGIVVEHGEGAAHTAVAIRTGEAGGAEVEAYVTRGAVLVARPHPDDDRRLLQALPQARNLIVLPLLTGDAALGVLAVERGGGWRARVPRSTVALLEQFAAHGALAYQKACLHRRLRHLAAVDGLTGLPNRRILDDALRREVQRAGRAGTPLSILMIDIDRFKRINDTHGHPVGDDVLRHVSTVLAGEVRGADLLARFGGEEFAVLMPGCGASTAARAAERLRAAVARSPGPVPATVSVGVATAPRDAADEAGLVAASDRALYRAKAAGRNRVIAATAPLVAPRPEAASPGTG